MPPRRRLAAVMFTDLVGFAAATQENEREALELLDRHYEQLRAVFPGYRGREIKTVGDAFLVEFESALDAVECAVEIQRRLHDFNTDRAHGRPIHLRIGIHVGDVVESDGDVLGDAVNIASRVEPLAEPGGVCLTQQVYDQVHNKLPLSLARLPATSLKNIRDPVSVYAVRLPWTGISVGPVVPPPVAGRQLAVLPLANISPDPHDEYFADGLTEELIAVLSQVRGLTVIARTSVIPYKTAPKPVAQVGAELGVDTVLEGSVRKSGNRIRVTLQLIDAATQRHIWASRYDREIDDVFAVQTDVAERTAEALRLELAEAERESRRRVPTANPAAYDAYLRALVAAQDPDETGLAEAERGFEEATRLDPTFAEAFAAWGNMYISVAGDSVPMPGVMPRARELAARALELDPNSSEAHATMANLAFQFDHDWALAEREFETAIAINPSNVTAHQFYALAANALGRFDRARELLQRAIQLDPRGRHRLTLAWIDVQAGHAESALRWARDAVEKSPGAIGPRIMLGLYAVQGGARDEAVRAAAVPLDGATPSERFDHALLEAMLGNPEEARAQIAEVDRGEARSYTSGTHLAMLCSLVGDTDRALGLLEKDFRDGERTFWLWFRGAFYDPIRGDPRFTALLRAYGLPTDDPRRRRDV